MADTIRGLTDEQLTDYEQRAEQAMLTALESVMGRIAEHLGATRTAAALVAAGPESVSPDDLAGITPLWSQAVEQDLLPVVAEVYQDAAGTVHAQLIDATDLPTIPPVTSLASEAYLAQATNTFEEVGADLWETARGELLDGFQEGESIPELRDRLRASAGLTGRNATLVARTQVLDASNAGSYDTARVSGLDLLKGWEATPDARTRDTHSAAGAFYQGDGMIALNGKFVVGGFQCDRPHDPSLPPSERYRCRCTLIYAMAPAVPTPPKDRTADIEAWHAQRLAQVKALHDQRLAEAAARHARKLADLDATDAAETVVDAARARHAARLAKLNAAFEARRVALAEERARRLGEQVVRPEPSPSPAVPSVTTVTREEAERLVADLPEGPDIYYHGTRSTVDDLDRKLASLSPDDPDGEIYLTDNPEFSLPYLEGDPGTVHAIRLSESARIASEDELWEAAEDALPGGVEGFFGYRPYAFDLAEHPQVRAELGRRGFDGAAFRDIAPNNVVEHDSVVVWSRAAVVGRVDRREVPRVGEAPLPSAVSPEPPSGVPSPVGPTPVPVRPALMQAESIPEVKAAFVREWQAILDRNRPRLIASPSVRFIPDGDVQTAREHAEGLLRALERFPRVPMAVSHRSMRHYAQADLESMTIQFGNGFARDRAAYLASLREAGTPYVFDPLGVAWHPMSTASPQGVAMHEFGHLLHHMLSPLEPDPTVPGVLAFRYSTKVDDAVKAIVRDLAAARGVPADELIKREIGEYAATNTHELIGEAFADAMVNGDAASVLSRRIMAVLVDEYDQTVSRGRLPRGGPPAGTVLPSTPRPEPVQVRPRPSLVAATSTDEINTAFLAEWQRAVQGLPQRRRPTIRPPMVRFGGDLDTAREHAEGLLRSVEQFPAVRLRIGRDPVGAEYASTEGTFITFVDTWAANRPAYLANLAQSAARRWHPPSISSPGGVAAHEFAHALIYTVAPKLASPAKFRALVARITATVRAYAAERGLSMDEVIKAEVSEWAALGTGRAGSAMEELAAEAFAQVLLEGDAAPVLARRVFALLVDEYDRAVGPGRARPALGRVLPPAPAPVQIAERIREINKVPTTAPRQLRLKIKAELERQAEVNPAVLAEIRRIEIATQDTWDAMARRGLIDPNGFAAYHYTDHILYLSPRWAADRAALDRTIKGAFEQDNLAWSFPGYEMRNLDTAASVIRHELGHITANRFPNEALGEIWTPQQIRQLVVPIAEELGVAPPLETVTSVAEWFNSELVQRAVRTRVSGYATKSFNELTAELWAVYSGRGTAASAIARRIGAILEARWAGLAPAPAVVEPGLARMTAKEFEARAQAAITGHDALDVPKYDRTKAAPGQNGPPERDTYRSLIPDEELRRQTFRAIESYGGAAYRPINGLLRGQADEFDSAKESVYRDQIAAIDRAMRASPLDHDVILWRGIEEGKEGSPFSAGVLRGDLTGLQWTDPAFVSTGVRESTARKSYAGEVLMRILVPRGTEAIKMSSRDWEAEVLLQRGLTFRVVRDHGRQGRIAHVVDVEIVPIAVPVEPGLARGVAEALQALTTGRTLTEVRTLLEALPEAKDALTVARRATSTEALTRSLNALATRRGLTLPSAKELKAIQTAERAALVAERKAARAAAAEAARVARAEKARAAEVKRQVKAVEQGDFTTLTRIGPQGGAMPGGLFEDAAGGRWYVKQAVSDEHARSEALALALYRAAGLDAPDMVIGGGAPGLDGVQVATRFLPDAQVDLLDRLTDADYIAEVRRGFGMDAWLANWDVVGANPEPGKGWDNIVSSGGRPWRIDAGGALRFRGLGGPKGNAFGREVLEWDTLRDAAMAERASQVFGGMTRMQLKEAAERVRAVSPARIKTLVRQHGLDPDLADVLIARRADLLARAARELDPSAKFKALLQTAVRNKPALDIPPIELAGSEGLINDPVVISRGFGSLGARRGAVTGSLYSYRSVGYGPINTYLRTGSLTDDRLAQLTGIAKAERIAQSDIANIDFAMGHSTLTDDVLVYRGLADAEPIFGEFSTWPADLTGWEWTDQAYLSTTISRARVRDIMYHLTGDDPQVLLRIVAPRGTKAITLSKLVRGAEDGYGEGEILLDRNLRLRVVADHGVERGTGIRLLDVEVVLAP